jgi:hypothetical protein
VKFSVDYLGTYGWTLFLFLPFIQGILVVLLYSWSEQRTLKECLGIAFSAVMLWGLLLLLFAMEGVICLVMVLPLAVPLALLGGLVGYFIQRRVNVAAYNHQIIPALILLVPLAMGTEHRIAQPMYNEVTTVIEVNAPPEKVWPQLVNLGGLSEPKEIEFKHGTAYPVGTLTKGEGVGATRLCRFSMGDIVERIDVWESGRRLRFTIVEQPEMFKELTPYENVDPPHVRLNYVRSRVGEFNLVALPNGRTQVIGTSWYESKLWPGWYWQIFTDKIAHDVHRRVFARIKEVSEQNNR